MHYWLEEIVQPNLAPKTYEKYELFTRLHIIPHLGDKTTGQAPGQGHQAVAQQARPDLPVLRTGQGRRPARGASAAAAPSANAATRSLSAGTRKDARNALRAALTCAVEEQIIARNPRGCHPAAQPPRPRRKRRSWTVDEARQFLESARRDDDVLYAAYVLVLVLGLRKGEVLGLTWELVNLDAGELYVGEQVQRVGHQLLRRETKTEASEAPLPLPDLCVDRAEAPQAAAGRRPRARRGAWIDTGLVFTTRHGTPIEPRNFNRSFDRRIVKAKVPRITVHGARKTCGSLLAALDVHPRVAMQILRHSKIAVTMEIYTEVPSAATRDALKKLGRWLGAREHGRCCTLLLHQDQTAGSLIGTGL